MTAATKPRLLVNMGILGASQALTQMLNLASLIVVARVLSTRDFGIVQMGVVLSAYALLIAEMGLMSLGIRQLSRLDAVDAVREYVRTHLGLLLVLAITVVGIGWWTLPSIPFTANAPTVFVLYLLFVIPQIFMLDWVTTGLQRMKWTGLFWIARSLVYAILVFVVLPSADGLLGLDARTWVPVFYLIAFVLADLLLALRIRSLLGSSALAVRLGPVTQWRQRLEESVPIGMSMIVMRLLMTVDLLVLGWLEAPETVGLYAAAAKPVAILLIGTNVAWKALLPRLARLWSESTDDFHRSFGRFAGLAVVLLAPVAVGGNLMGDELIQLIYGDRYEGAGALLSLLAIAYPLLALGIFVGNGLIACDRQTAYFPRVTVAATVLVVLEIVLVPRYGSTGAAGAMIAGSSLLVLSSGTAMAKALKGEFWRNLAVAVAASLAMAVVLSASARLFGSADAPASGAPSTASNLSTVLRLMLGAVAYAAIALPLLWHQLLSRRTAPPSSPEES